MFRGKRSVRLDVRIEVDGDLVRDIRRVAAFKGVAFKRLVEKLLRGGIASDVVDLDQRAAHGAWRFRFTKKS